jgi:hypothetical protein
MRWLALVYALLLVPPVSPAKTRMTSASSLNRLHEDRNVVIERVARIG